MPLAAVFIDVKLTKRILQLSQQFRGIRMLRIGAGAAHDFLAQPAHFLVQGIGGFGRLGKLLYNMIRNLLLILVVENMLHAGPEIHSERSHLNLDLHPALSLQESKRHSHDQMQALIAIGFRVLNIVLNLQNREVFPLLEMLQQTVNILNEGEDDTHSGDIVNFVHHVVDCNIVSFALQLAHNALRFFNSRFYMLDRAVSVLDFPFGLNKLDLILQFIQCKLIKYRELLPFLEFTQIIFIDFPIQFLQVKFLQDTLIIFTVRLVQGNLLLYF